MSQTKTKSKKSQSKNHAETGGAAKKPAPSNSKWLIAVTVALATFMEILDDTSVSVALAQIAGNLSAGVDEVTWIVTAQLVAKAIVLPIAGFLATTVGRARLFSICLLAYGATSLLCGLAPTIEILVFFRIVQGMSGGFLSPLAQAILIDSFPPSQRGIALAVYGVAAIVAPTIGPTFGGFIVDNYSWSWVFYVNIPVAIITAFLVSTLVKDPPELNRERARLWKSGLQVDYWGLGLLAVGLAALQIVLSRGENEQWFDSPYIIILSVIAAVALVVGIVWELFHKNPVIELRLLFNRSFAAAMLVMFTLGVVLFGSSTQLPLFLQNVLGYTAINAGLAISPGGAVVLVLLPFVGLLSSKVEARWLIMIGLSVSAVSFYYFTQIINTQVDFSTVAWARVYQMAGIAFLFIPINVAAYVGISKAKTNQASTIINLAFSLGGSFGIAAVTTLLSRRAQFHQSRLVDNLDVFNPQYQATLQYLTNTFAAQGGTLAEATARAQAAIYGIVRAQANALSFVDAFQVLAVISLIALPLVFIMKGNKPGDESEAAAAG